MPPTAKAIYAVIAWVPPEVEADYLQWLDDGHIAEVAAQPGFLSGRRIALTQTDTAGRRGHLSLYDVATQADLDAYLASADRQRFIAYGKRFAGVRMERLDGVVKLVA